MITLKEFMSVTAYGTYVHATTKPRKPKEPAYITCTPSTYFHSAAPNIVDFIQEYQNWEVHGIRITGDAIQIDLYPTEGGAE